jgi:hypothetical protein
MQKNSWLRMFLRDSISLEMLFGAIVPLTGYLLLRRLYDPMLASIAVICFLSGLNVFYMIQRKRIEFFSSLSLGILLISLITVSISKDERFFIYSGLIDEIVLTFIFGISLFLKKPMMQIIAENVRKPTEEIALLP